MIIKDPLVNLSCKIVVSDCGEASAQLEYEEKIIGELETVDYSNRYLKNPIQDAFSIFQKGYPVLVISYETGGYFNLQNYFWTGDDVDVSNLRILISYTNDGTYTEKLFKVLV